MPVYKVYYRKLNKKRKDFFILLADDENDAYVKAFDVLEAIGREDAEITKIKLID